MIPPEVHELARAVWAGGELPERQRELLASLLYHIESAMATPGAVRYPHDIERAAYWDAAGWEPVAQTFPELIECVAGRPPGAGDPEHTTEHITLPEAGER